MTVHAINLPGNLYNIMLGYNTYSMWLMGVLGIFPGMTGRYRDCYLQRETDGKLCIHIFTRNGGGNRPAFEEVTAIIRKHPMFVRDFDDSFDSTYASYVFRLPEHMQAAMEQLVEKDPKNGLPGTHAERFRDFMARIDSNDEDVVRAKAQMGPLFEAMTGAAVAKESDDN